MHSTSEKHKHNHKHEHEHKHKHGHEHGHNHDSISPSKLGYCVLLNLLITVSEIIGGVLSNSLYLISDALHNFLDTFSMVLSLIALFISKKSSDPSKTFGYKRSEIIAAFVNIILLIVISVFLFKEAVERLLHPVPIVGFTMLIIAVIGLLGNLFSALLLYKDSKKSLNIKSSFLHILTDTLSSVSVIVGSLLILFFKWYFIDPLLTFIIGIYVLFQSWHMLLDVMHILMQGAPARININELKNRLESLAGVKDVHHIHIWSLTESLVYFEGHISIENITLENMEQIKQEIKKTLKDDFDISHSTIEFETSCCSCSETFQE